MAELFRKLLPAGWFYQSQEPITLEDGEPEPDGAVVRGTIDDYAQRHPGLDDIALLIEVADTTISRDRGTKLRSYARAGVAEYWIINTIDQVLEVYRNPNRKTASYEPAIKFSRADSVEFQLPGSIVMSIQVGELLGEVAT